MAIAVRRASLLALVLFLAACAGTSRRGTRSDADLEAASRVTITNQSWYEVVMYVNRGGQRVRLGEVGSQSTRAFRLPSGLQYGTIRFIADPVGSRQTAQSWDMALSTGENIGLTIPPTAFR